MHSIYFNLMIGASKIFNVNLFSCLLLPRENTEGKERSHNGRQHKMTDKINDNINMYITGHFYDVIVYHMLSHASL